MSSVSVFFLTAIPEPLCKQSRALDSIFLLVSLQIKEKVALDSANNFCRIVVSYVINALVSRMSFNLRHALLDHALAPAFIGSRGKIFTEEIVHGRNTGMTRLRNSAEKSI